MGKNSLFNNQQNEKATYRMGGNICNPISEKSLIYKTHKNYYNSTAKGKKKKIINKYPLGRQRADYKGETSQVPRPKETSNLGEET